tara:strand:+ start:438 stop:1055 length:618 start_codon:yes stop_codon:yes gene_type:complete
MSIVTLNDRGVRSVTTFGSVNTGSMVLIKKLTASSDDTLDFVDGTSNVVLDSTYKEYLFTFKNIHPGTNAQEFLFQGNAAGGSGFDETMTTTVFNANHNEAGSDTGLGYVGGSDQAQGTSFQKLTRSVGADADQICCGTLHLFNPSSTTFVKHYISTFQEANEGDYSMNVFTAGYFNTTSAIDEIQFKFASGNIEAGDICLYGIL